MSLEHEELQRYARHLSLPEVGIAGQEKIKQAKVLCIGAGGLGSPVISYLAAAGVGTLGIVDDDIVDLSNLQRQIIHSQANIGMPKVLSAAQWIANHNPHINVITYQERLTAANALEIITHYDIVIDGTDNFASRYLINDACFFAQKPNVFASIFRFEGQAAVFCTPEGPCYRCLFPEISDQEDIPNCVDGGVFGVLPGLLGILQATEALKLIVGCGEPLIKRLLTINALSMRFHSLSLLRNPECPLCGENPSITSVEMALPTCATVNSENEIDVTTLRKALSSSLTLIDVREPYELLQIEKIGNAHNIPLGEIIENLDKLPRDAMFVVYCKSGVRSAHAVKFLREQGFNCKNLIGGVEAWYSKL